MLSNMKGEGLLRLNVDFGEKVGESGCQLRSVDAGGNSLLVFILLGHWR